MFKRAFAFIRNLLEASRYSFDRPWLQQGYGSVRLEVTPSARKEVVRKSQYFELNSVVQARIADVFEAYTVGTGTQLIPASSETEWNLRAKKSWDTFCKYPVVDSRESMATFQSKVARRWFFDGESFILLTNGDSGRPRIQLVETNRINTPEILAPQEGETIFDGVNIDRTSGRPTGYYVGTETKGGQLNYGPPTAAEFVIHVCEPSRAGEYRCLPFSHSCINLLDDLDLLHRYEMKAAKMTADLALFIETENGEMPRGPFGGRYSRPGTKSDGTATTTTKKNYYKESTGGLAQVLERGDKISQMPGMRPSVVTQEFFRTLRMDICGAQCVPYVLCYPESLQGTVYRGAISMASTIFRARFEVLATAWVRIYEYYMKWAVRNDPTLAGAPKDFYAVTVQAPRSPTTDLGYESDSAIKEIKAGLSSYTTVLGPRSVDAFAEFRRRAEEVFAIKKLAQEFSRDGIEVKPEEIADLDHKSAEPPKIQNPQYA